jgi:glycerol uptake facilitator-like aquaporin
VLSAFRDFDDNDCHQWRDIWIFFLAPESAALVAGLLWRFLWSSDKGDAVALNADIDRVNREKDAETITVAVKGPDGKVDMNARLNGTLQELTEQVAAKFGVTKTCSTYVTLDFSGYQLQPATKIVREFTELCEVT